MKLVYYESSQADGALVLVLDKQDMPGLDYEAAVYMGDVTRAGVAELDDDTANKLLDMGMRQHRFYMSGFAPPKEGLEQPVADATPKSSWVDHIEGTLPADDLRRAFVSRTCGALATYRRAGRGRMTRPGLYITN